MAPSHTIAVRGMTYYLWLRARWSIGLIGAALVIAAVMARIWPHEQWLVFAGVMSSAAITMALAHLVGVLTYADRDMGAPESGFPRYMFVLPARSALLAAVPMFCAVALFIVTWALMSKLVIEPMILWEQKLTLSAVWPGFMLAAAITGLQATCWLPFWVPYVRVLASLGVLLLVVAIAVAGVQFAVPAWLLTGTFALLIFLFYPLGVSGVAQARRGGGVLSSWRRHATKTAALRTGRKPFASGLAAQIWLEVRRNILLVPCFGAGFPLFLAALSSFGSGHAVAIPVGPYLIEPIAILIAIVLAAPLFAAGMHGVAMGKSDAWTKATAIHPFIATRPLSTVQLVAAKFRAAVIATLVTWGLVLLIFAAWSLAPHTIASDQSLAQYTAAHASARTVAAASVALFWMIVLTWKQLAQGMCVSLYGRQWLSTAMPIASVLLMCALPSVAYVILRHQRVLHWFTLIGPWLISILAAARIVLGAWVLRICLTRGLLSKAEVGKIFAAWSMLVLLALASLMALLPWSPASLVKLVCAAVLIPPGVRCVLALPALHANRHR